MATDPDQERRKRVRRTAVILAIIAIAFYVAYIVLSMVEASRAVHRRGAPPASAPPPATAPR
ncbi:MAG TPA: hypothetical protein VN730_03925 [Steroidobacteraceae bacterium]|nr:hypothetical protein [Steroidobacteraceae bacterium]